MQDRGGWEAEKKLLALELHLARAHQRRREACVARDLPDAEAKDMGPSAAAEGRKKPSNSKKPKVPKPEKEKEGGNAQVAGAVTIPPVEAEDVGVMQQGPPSSKDPAQDVLNQGGAADVVMAGPQPETPEAQVQNTAARSSDTANDTLGVSAQTGPLDRILAGTAGEEMSTVPVPLEAIQAGLAGPAPEMCTASSGISAQNVPEAGLVAVRRETGFFAS